MVNDPTPRPEETQEEAVVEEQQGGQEGTELSPAEIEAMLVDEQAVDEGAAEEEDPAHVTLGKRRTWGPPEKEAEKAS